LGCVDEFLDCKLHFLDNEQCPGGNATGIIIWEEVGCKFWLETSGNVSGDELPDGCGDAKWAEFGVVVGVFVEAEKVDISEVVLDHVR
jgi:hypothetical protein